MQKTNQKEFRTEKATKRNGDELYVKWKGYDSSFSSWIDRKDRVLMSEYFVEPKSLRERMKVKVDFSNYATKTVLKNATGVNTSSFVKKVDLVNLKSSVDKVDIDKLKNVSTNLRNLESKVDKFSC